MQSDKVVLIVGAAEAGKTGFVNFLANQESFFHTNQVDGHESVV